jgi:hypothetical protein
MFNITKIQWILFVLTIFLIIRKTNEHLLNCENINSGTIPAECNILNKQECKDWADSRSKNFANKDYFCRSPTDCPRGCYAMNNKVYWNDNKLGRCSSNRVCIYKNL